MNENRGRQKQRELQRHQRISHKEEGMSYEECDMRDRREEFKYKEDMQMPAGLQGGEGSSQGLITLARRMEREREVEEEDCQLEREANTSIWEEM